MPLPPRQAAAALRRDTRSGATALAERAGALLAEAATGAGARSNRERLQTLARALVFAHPAMASICRVAHVALTAASADDELAAVPVAVTAHLAAIREAAEHVSAHAVNLLPPAATILTLSASSLAEAAILRAHRDGRRPRVVCLEARPHREGAGLATRLAAAGVHTELWVDAAAARCIARAHVVWVGADTLAPDGLVHKLGTLGLAVAARARGVPLYALAGADKLLPALVAGALDQRRPRGEVLRGGPPALTVANYYYDLTPLDLLTGVVTANGVRTTPRVTGIAARIRLHPALQALLVPEPAPSA